jgi:cold shock CspA family protein
MDNTNNQKRLTGKVISWKRDGGWGFAAGPDPAVGEDYFIHHSALRGRSYLVAGMTISFSPAINPRTNRVCALDVEVLEIPEAESTVPEPEMEADEKTPYRGTAGLGKPKAGPLDGLRGNGLGRSLSSIASGNNLTEQDEDSRGNR